MGRLSGDLHEVSADAGWLAPPPRKGFFTDTSICIGCKACEVACKQWNDVPQADTKADLIWTGDSYDNTGALGADTWRHVAFIEQSVVVPPSDIELVEMHGGVSTSSTSGCSTSGCSGSECSGSGCSGSGCSGSGCSGSGCSGSGCSGSGCSGSGCSGSGCSGFGCSTSGSDIEPVEMQGGVSTSSTSGDGGVRWLMSSDVCKHCTHAACLDVCPTGAIFRSEFGTVVIQDDVCNGCGYCIPACPYGVIDQRKGDGGAFKCTLCYDRLKEGETPACAQACPTQSIQFGDLDELRERAAGRVAELHERGVDVARLYGADPTDGVGGDGAFFLLLDEPEVYGLPPDPIVTTHDLPSMWRHVGAAAATLVAGAVVSFWGSRR